MRSFIDACVQLWKTGKNFSLTITGDGPEREMLEKKMNNSDYEKFVQFTGFKKEKELNEAFNEHKILVVPSRWKEPFGIVALEGLAAGCLVLCSDGGGLPEAVGEFGTRFKRNSLEDLSDKLEGLLNKGSVDTDQHQLHLFLSDKTPEITAKKYLDILCGR